MYAISCQYLNVLVNMELKMMCRNDSHCECEQCEQGIVLIRAQLM